MTKKELLTAIADYFEAHVTEESFPRKEAIDLMYKEISRLSSKSPSAIIQQKEVAIFRQAILQILKEHPSGMTVKDITSEYNKNNYPPVSISKTSAAVTFLKKNGKAIRDGSSRTPIFLPVPAVTE